MSTQRLLSGIQPTGILNIGNYLGAIKQWLGLQNNYQCLFTIVDLHALTVKQDPKVLQERCYDLAALYLACGIDPTQSILFIQSHVPQHTALSWILCCNTYMGELSRMTQFKDKSKQHQNNINAGLFNYPVLQAADILLYQTNLVPVGSDQKQHLELCRDLALRFNQNYSEVFVLPEPMIPQSGSRIMNLQEPAKKMSKSDPVLSGVLALLDPPKVIIKKVKRAVTDSDAAVSFDTENKPGISNLLTLFSKVTDQSIESLEKTYTNLGYGQFKSDLADAIVALLEPIQERFIELRADQSALDGILFDGASKARHIAQNTIKKVYNSLGFIPDAT